MKKNSKRADAIREELKDMPSLYHSFERKPFDISESQVVDYLLNCPSIMQMAFDTAKELGAIIFDPKTKTWCGPEYMKKIGEEHG